MNRYRRAVFAAALSVAVCVGSGCRHTAPSGQAAPWKEPFHEPTKSVTLNPAEERRAEAMAAYATGVSQELTEGLDAALPDYNRAFELDPKNAMLAARLAQIYLSHKDTTNALAVLESATKANPSSPEPWVWLGVTYRSVDNSPKAVAAFRQALKLDPQHTGAMRALLEIYLNEDDNPAIKNTLDQAFKQSSKDPDYWTSLGDIIGIVLRQKPSLAQQIDHGRIRQCYERALALAPSDPDVLTRVAELYLEANDFKAAAEAYAKLLRLRPDLPRLRERLAMTYLRADQKEKAVGILEEIVKRDPNRYETYNTLGLLYEDLDKDQKAITNYQLSLVLNPTQFEIYVSIVQAQLRLKEIDEALKTLAAAKEKFPNKYQVPFLYGLVYSDQKKYAQAITAFADAEALAREIPEDEPKPSSMFYFTYGAACERAGDPDKAATLFKKAIELDPKNDNAYNYLGYMWADKGLHLNESLELINKAVQLSPDNGAYLDSLGWVLFKLGRTEEALPHLQRAVQLTKDDATVLDHLAEVLIKLGRHDEAIDLLRRAQKAEPENKEIAEKLQRYLVNHTAAPTAPAPPQSPTP